MRVTNRRNGKSVMVRINDRGPFVRGRIIDVTPAAARALGFSGVAPVSIESAASVANFGSSIFSGKSAVSARPSNVSLALGKD